MKVNILELEGGNGKSTNNGDILFFSFSRPPIILVLIGIIIFLSITSMLTYRYRKTHTSLPIEYKKYERVSAKEVQSIKKIKYATKILNDLINNDSLLDLINYEGESNLNKVELNMISENFLHKVDTLKWDDENQKIEFIKEMLALTPEERDDILSYMIEKSNKNNIYS